MKTVEVSISINFLSAETEEIIIALLPEIGYDGFWQENNSIKAYISQAFFNEKKLTETLNEINPSITFNVGELPDKNWNEEWEKSYEPVIIENRCVIKAPFHKIEQKYPLEIIISPKMSFGTGHHFTTQLMLENMFELDFNGKTVIDAGCGSGILSICAEKLGAIKITAFDIDEWSENNTKENIHINHCNKIEVKKGDIAAIHPEPANILLANINRNVLLDEMHLYYSHLLSGGHLVLSGFLVSDMERVKESALSNGFQVQHEKAKNDWCALIFKK